MQTKTIRTSSTEEIRIKYGLHQLKGNAKPYFSITCTVFENGRDVGGGCMHERVLEQWPEAAPLVALHLSDIDGVPMHALENARYWAGMTHWQAAKPDVLASHLRITIEQAASMVGMSETDFHNAVECMRPRWKAEADDAIARFNLTGTHG